MVGEERSSLVLDPRGLVPAEGTSWEVECPCEEAEAAAEASSRCSRWEGEEEGMGEGSRLEEGEGPEGALEGSY